MRFLLAIAMIPMFALSGTAYARDPDVSIELWQNYGGLTGIDVCALEFGGAIRPPPNPKLIGLLKRALDFCISVDPGRDIGANVEFHDEAIDIGGEFRFDHKTRKTRFVTSDHLWDDVKKITP